MTAETAMVVFGLVALVVGGGGAWAALRWLVGKSVLRLELPLDGRFEVTLPPARGRYTLWLEVATESRNDVPRPSYVVIRTPSASLWVGVEGRTVLEGTFRREGMMAYDAHEIETPSSSYSRDRKPLVELPALGPAPAVLRGALVSEPPPPHITMRAALVVTRKGR